MNTAYSELKCVYKPKCVFIELLVDPHRVDVNIHPSKKRVAQLLDTAIIAAALTRALKNSLVDVSFAPSLAHHNQQLQQWLAQRENKHLCLKIKPASSTISSLRLMIV